MFQIAAFTNYEMMKHLLIFAMIIAWNRHKISVATGIAVSPRSKLSMKIANQPQTITAQLFLSIYDLFSVFFFCQNSHRNSHFIINVND